MSDNQASKPVTQSDVARHAGVTRSMVSYVINNAPGKVSEDARNRVLAAIKELGYRPNKHAQLLSSVDSIGVQKYIGIVLAGKYMFKRPYYGTMLASIHERAHEQGWHIRFIRLFEDFSNPTLFNELIHPNEIAGVILLGLDQVMRTAEDRTLIEAIVQRVERIVCVDWVMPGIPSVQFDHQNAAYQATRHLIECERAKIAYIGPFDKRLQGYQQALWENGIVPEEAMTYFANEPDLGFEACERLIQLNRPIDAISVGTDEVAIAVLNCLHRHHLQVPGDIAIASIDNIELSAFIVPALTTINVPKDATGSHAIDILVSEKPQRGASAFTIMVPTELIIRESSIMK